MTLPMETIERASVDEMQLTDVAGFNVRSEGRSGKQKLFPSMSARRNRCSSGSGCGKSTLARIVTGLDRATSGQIRLAGENIAELQARSGRHAAIVR